MKGTDDSRWCSCLPPTTLCCTTDTVIRAKRDVVSGKILVWKTCKWFSLNGERLHLVAQLSITVKAFSGSWHVGLSSSQEKNLQLTYKSFWLLRTHFYLPIWINISLTVSKVLFTSTESRQTTESPSVQKTSWRTGRTGTIITFIFYSLHHSSWCEWPFALITPNLILAWTPSLNFQKVVLWPPWKSSFIYWFEIQEETQIQNQYT